MSIASYNCPLCNFISPTRNLWLSHIRSVHSDDDHFSLVCGISGCSAFYSKCSSFVSHVYRKHRDILCAPEETGQSSPINTAQEPRTSTSEPSDPTTLLEPSGSEYEYRTADVDMQHTMSHLLGTDSLMQRKKSALYILNLKEIHGLSEVAVRNVIQETQLIFSHTVHRIKAGVSEHLSRSGIEAPSNLYEMFSDVSDPFQGLHSTHLQERFYVEHLDCIVRTFYIGATDSLY